jgi:hypothetical protein
MEGVEAVVRRGAGQGVRAVRHGKQRAEIREQRENRISVKLIP